MLLSSHSEDEPGNHSQTDFLVHHHQSESASMPCQDDKKVTAEQIAPPTQTIIEKVVKTFWAQGRLLRSINLDGKGGLNEHGKECKTEPMDLGSLPLIGNQMRGQILGKFRRHGQKSTHYSRRPNTYSNLDIKRDAYDESNPTVPLTPSNTLPSQQSNESIQSSPMS